MDYMKKDGKIGVEKPLSVRSRFLEHMALCRHTGEQQQLEPDTKCYQYALMNQELCIHLPQRKHAHWKLGPTSPFSQENLFSTTLFV